MMKLSEDSERHAPTAKGETRRIRLIEVATEEFLAIGYAQTSMKTIVQKAGGSAATAYQLFSSKEGLLAAVLQHEFDGLEAQSFPLGLMTKEPAQALPEIAMRLLTYLGKPRSVDFFRLLIAEGHRMPGISAYFRQLVSLQVIVPLERYLRDACDRGELALTDPLRGARTIGNLLQGIANESRIAGGYATELPEADKDACTYVIDMLLRAWSVPNGQNTPR